MQLIELRLAWMIEILLGAGSNPVHDCAITELFICPSDFTCYEAWFQFSILDREYLEGFSVCPCNFD